MAVWYNKKMKIVFPEIENPVIKAAVERISGLEAVKADDLRDACVKVVDGTAEALVAGIDYTSVDVLRACRDVMGVQGRTFSSSFVMFREDEVLVLADAATNKTPNTERLIDIIIQTYETARRVVREPRVAVLAYSTHGSGGEDEGLQMLRTAVDEVRLRRPEIMIDGEMQLDAAVSAEVAAKKCPDSEVAGRANVLICPDLNAGNILYKALEQFGGFVAAGPILQGFNGMAADLSRGSSVEDVVATIQVLMRLKEKK